MICKKCGNELDNNLNYCNKCGTLVKTPNWYTGIVIVLLLITILEFTLGLNGIGIEEWYGRWLFACSISAMFFGIICKVVGDSKGIYCGFVLGWFFGILGLAIVAALPNKKNIITTNTNIEVDKYDKLEKLQKLKNSGAVTEKEYEIEKAKILNH